MVPPSARPNAQRGRTGTASPLDADGPFQVEHHLGRFVAVAEAIDSDTGAGGMNALIAAGDHRHRRLRVRRGKPRHLLQA